MNKLILSFLLLSAVSASADVRLPRIISSGMVLQQNAVTKIWGWANPSAKIVITTSWNNHTDTTRADGNAKWNISLATPAAGGPYTITIKENNTIVLKDILIGEVWVCSGQSNMEWNYMRGLPQMKDEIPIARNTNIRFFQVAKTTAETPQEDLTGMWATCDSNTIKYFSAVAYYFGRKLNKEMNVPIGLISAAWGGTAAETWTPSEIVLNNTKLLSSSQKLKPSVNWPITPGYTYNAMIAPLTNYKIAGVIWYQGENNAGNASTYQLLLSSMINTWRKKWNDDFPFYLVQIAPYSYGYKNIGALLREAQQQTLSVPQTGMVVTTDLVEDTTDVHPRDKKSVGERLANLALYQTYHAGSINPYSPLYAAMEIDHSKIRLYFKYASDGLFCKDDEINSFFIAGKDEVFYPASATIEKDKIIVWSNSVPKPVAVRYAFSNTASGNVFGRNMMPVAPFRTDSWNVNVGPIK